MLDGAASARGESALCPQQGKKHRMDQWFMANLGDAMLAGDELDHVCALFELQGNRSPTTAVLMRHENLGRLHCELVLYFPPNWPISPREWGRIPAASRRCPDWALQSVLHSALPIWPAG